ncbi:hypothetical protein E2C01_044468 [Portunus trituberculatus]|uniref:Uncharacterized protein n=1 Tax=Portunus trituberculatus TaxID=210409 RepID=A0A5B7FZF5_PORTR|nr:hypothetical protein [Portunus trituberculatus]
MIHNTPKKAFAVPPYYIPLTCLSPSHCTESIVHLFAHHLVSSVREVEGSPVNRHSATNVSVFRDCATFYTSVHLVKHIDRFGIIKRRSEPLQVCGLIDNRCRLRNKG